MISFAIYGAVCAIENLCSLNGEYWWNFATVPGAKNNFGKGGSF